MHYAHLRNASRASAEGERCSGKGTWPAPGHAWPHRPVNKGSQEKQESLEKWDPGREDGQIGF